VHLPKKPIIDPDALLNLNKNKFFRNDRNGLAKT